MKTKIFSFLILMLFAYNCCIAQNAKADLKKLTWIEGNWKGMDGNNPFYEIYKIKNDSTLVITSYEWNGKDSSKSSVSILWRKDGYYYLGDSLNWRSQIFPKAQSSWNRYTRLQTPFFGKKEIKIPGKKF